MTVTTDTTQKRIRRGTHRVHPVENTWSRIAPLLGRAGVTRVADITGLDTLGIPVTLAIRPNALTSTGATGKGVTLLAAKVSGAMEAVEIHHAETCELPTVSASGRQMRSAGPGGIDVRTLPRAAGMRIDEDCVLQWCEAVEWVSSTASQVPYDLVHMHEVGSSGLESPFQRTTNGLASGNTPLEAVLSGLYEVIERDALAVAAAADPVWRRSGSRLVDVRALGVPDIDQLLDAGRAAGAAVLIHDLTSDIGVPVFGAHIVDLHGLGLANGIGYGAHLETEVAILRAITEAAQGRTVSIAGSRDDHTRHEAHHQRRAAQDPSHWLTLASRSHPVPTVQHATDTLDEDFERVVARLRRIGIRQVFVTDLSRAEFGHLPVVRVTVPGLEGIVAFPTYTPGRRADQVRLA